MSFYLFNDIFIDFDYKQNIVQGDCAIISKEFGQYKYDIGIDSMNLNIPKELLHTRILVSNADMLSLDDPCLIHNNSRISFLDLCKLKGSKDLTIYLDKENYAIIFSSYLKSACPNMTNDSAYDLYTHLLTVYHSLGSLNYSSYILSKEDFNSLYNTSTKCSIDTSQLTSIHLLLKFATIYSGKYTLDQLEDLKAILIKTAENFYVRMFKKFYRKIVENYHTSNDNGLVRIKDNKIVWKIMDDREISSTDDIDLDLIRHFCSNPNLITEECKDFIEVQVVGQDQSFKKLLNMRQELYQRINKNYKGIIRADPVHYFFMDRSPSRFNPIEFIKYCANFHFNSDIFASDTFAGSIHYVASYIFDLIRKDSPNIKCFSLNKL